MAIPRKRALKRLQSLAEQVELHLVIIASNPGDRATAHHRHEARIWLDQMERVLRHVGKKTAAEWEVQLSTYRAALED
jgi:hypothetical protein